MPDTPFIHAAGVHRHLVACGLLPCACGCSTIRVAPLLVTLPPFFPGDIAAATTVDIDPDLTTAGNDLVMVTCTNCRTVRLLDVADWDACPEDIYTLGADADAS